MQRKVAITRSQYDQENAPELLNEGDQIEFQEQESQRLIDLSDCGIVCEI